MIAQESQDCKILQYQVCVRDPFSIKNEFCHNFFEEYMIKKYRKVLSLRTKLFYWKIVCVKMSLKKKIEFLWNRGQKRLNPIKIASKTEK